MKKPSLLLAAMLCLVLSYVNVYAQPPQKINYQSVIRNLSGDPVANQNVSLRFSVHTGSAGGTVQYSETFSTSTNDFGLVNVQLGTGSIVSGAFTSITWFSGTKYLQTEADITGGVSYIDLGTVELISVPYAFYAEKSGSSAIIPFASGLPVVMTTILGGLVGTVSTVGFGSSATGLSILGGNIDLTGGTGLAINNAFVAPRSGTLTSMSAFFSNTVALNLVATTINLQAQLYTATSGSNSFSPVLGAVVSLSPSLTGALAIGSTTSGIASGLSAPIVAGNRYMLVYSATASGLNLINVVTGYGSGGLSIN